MASHPDVPNKVEVTAVTTTPHEHVTLNWTVKNFKTLVQSASPTLDGNDVVVASLPFKLRATLFPPGTPRVAMYWALKVMNKAGSKVVRLELTLKTLKEDLPRNLYTLSSLSIYKDKQFTQLCSREGTGSILRNHTISTGWGWDFHPSNLTWWYACVDSEGSLNLQLKTDFYVDFDAATADILEVKQNSPETEVESLKRRKGIILNQIASLLGNEITSDVIVSVRTTEDVEIGTFFSHSAVLSGQSSVLRQKLKQSTERKDDKVLLTLEEDVDLEVIHQFLTFIYAGRLKDTRKDDTSADPLWVESLPELVQLALKYEVDDLVDFCDLNLYRAAMESSAKAAEIVCLAKRLNLKRTLEKLRTEFSKDNELLFQSICP